ncbi:MAG: alpha-galactosidase [Clostridia bacterium]|nr:alpha-galactosidase [Clostridia bacterium]
MNESGGRFIYDGVKTLTVVCYPGQTLYYNETCDPFAEWEKYNRLILENREQGTTEGFWSELEYCTWVDQKREAVLNGSKNMQSALCEEYVYRYMDRVERLGLPKGKLTIDDGWDVQYTAEGRRIYGNWEINREKFPHMEQLVKDMTARGFVPGIWFAPFTFTPDCSLAQEHPELIGKVYSQSSESGLKWVFIRPDPVLEEYYTKIFSRYISMGFRKLKLDIAYGPKDEMKELLKIMYTVVKKIDPTVEVECHIPDIFVSQYCDTVRINDVNFDPEGLWRGVTMEHYKVCKYSAGNKTLNLDHLGTNDPMPEEKDYLDHTNIILSLDGGYPCVSLLPDVFSKETQDSYVNMIHAWCNKRK